MLDMQRTTVCVGVDSHRRDAEFTTRSHKTQRDLASVGNQDLAKGSHQ
jgi:hypothetical protein